MDWNEIPTCMIETTSASAHEIGDVKLWSLINNCLNKEMVYVCRTNLTVRLLWWSREGWEAPFPMMLVRNPEPKFQSVYFGENYLDSHIFSYIDWLTWH